jgi:hypothetical protein
VSDPVLRQTIELYFRSHHTFCKKGNRGVPLDFFELNSTAGKKIGFYIK